MREPQPQQDVPKAIFGPIQAAVVTTMAYNTNSLDSFLCYYLFIGFAKMYVYIDDPTDATVAIARRYPSDRVQTIVRGTKLEREWRQLPSWSRLQLYAGREVQARQQLNCEHAMSRCRHDGMAWLLHVDSDELLYLPVPSEEFERHQQPRSCHSSALQGHLARLEELGALMFTYRNVEAVPEQLEGTDPLREVGLFKQHPSCIDETLPLVAAAKRYWCEAADAGGEIFRFYTTGKSIVRVDDAIREAGSVHEWTLPSKQVAASSGFTNNRELRHSQYVYHQLLRQDEGQGAMILHFAVCSFDTFWSKRWAALGYASPNHRFRGGGAGLDQRANALALAERRDEAEAFYRRSMMVSDEHEKQRQLKAGVCIHLDARQLVEAARLACLPANAMGMAEASIWPANHSRHQEPSPAFTMREEGNLVVERAAEQKLRRRAQSAVAGDAVLERMVSQAFDDARDVAAHLAREMSDADDKMGATYLIDARYTNLFELVLARTVRATLTLLPVGRLAFDLVGYWKHPSAASILEPRDVATLLQDGSVYLDGRFPTMLVDAACAEADDFRGRNDGGEACLSDLSTSRATERNAWLLSSEAPSLPNAPVPEVTHGTALPADLYGPAFSLNPTRHPALRSAIRGLRALAAQLEAISELRLSAPRGALLREIHERKWEGSGPDNSGWPDTGCEVMCSLILGRGGSNACSHVDVRAHGQQRSISLQPGGVMLTLARQAKVKVHPSVCHHPEQQVGTVPLWLSLPIYSTSLRSAADGRMLGISKAAIMNISGQIRRGELHEGLLKQ